MSLENKNDNGMTMTTKTDLQSAIENVKLESNVKSSQSEKDDFAKMPYGMVP